MKIWSVCVQKKAGMMPAFFCSLGLIIRNPEPVLVLFISLFFLFSLPGKQFGPGACIYFIIRPQGVLFGFCSVFRLPDGFGFFMDMAFCRQVGRSIPACLDGCTICRCQFPALGTVVFLYRIPPDWEIFWIKPLM